MNANGHSRSRASGAALPACIETVSGSCGGGFGSAGENDFRSKGHRILLWHPVRSACLGFNFELTGQSKIYPKMPAALENFQGNAILILHEAIVQQTPAKHSRKAIEAGVPSRPWASGFYQA